MGLTAMSSGCELHLERGRIRSVEPCDRGIVIHSEQGSVTFPTGHLYPGFVDAHVHLLGVGKRLTTPSLHNATSEDDCISILQRSSVPADGWLQAMGWNQESWTVSSLPTSQALTAAFPSIPVVCSRVDGHAFWVNAEAMRLAGIRHATGLLVDEEMVPIFRALPTPSRETIEHQLISAATLFARAGVTEVHDMDVAPDVVAITRSLAEQARMPIRVQSFVSAQNDEWVTANMLPAGGERQRTAGVKMYADGALGSRGASLLQPYSDANHRGTALLTATQIEEKTLEAARAGWWCAAVHAIGDAAVRTVLDAFQKVRNHPDGQDIHLRIEHAQHVHSDDVRRFADLGVTASVQPAHAESDVLMAIRRLGSKRMPEAYRWKSLLQAGANVCFGTDAPIEPVHTLRTLDVAVHGPLGSDNQPPCKECVTIEQATQAATQWAHASVGLDYRRGQLLVGMDADLVVLDQPLTVSDASSIRGIKVLATFTAGILHTAD